MTAPQLPRGLVVLLGTASAVVVVAGMKAAAWLLAPTLLALVIVIVVSPAHRWLRRHRVPAWCATLALVLLVYGVLLTFMTVLAVAVLRLGALLPRYTDQARAFADLSTDRPRVHVALRGFRGQDAALPAGDDRLRAGCGGAGHARVAVARHSAGLPVGPAVVRDQLHPERRVRRRCRAAHARRPAQRRVAAGADRGRGLRRDQLRPPVPGAAALRRRRGRVVRDAHVRVAGVLGLVLGPLGVLLATPATLLVMALLVDLDPKAAWATAILRAPRRSTRAE